MPDVPCKKCRKIFYSKPSWIKKGKGKFCSIRCSAQSQKKGKIIHCFICRKEVYKQRRALIKSKNKKFFCGMKCSLQWHNSVFIGRKHPNWKKGEYAYKAILKRQNFLEECVLCGTKNKQVLIVHHIDKNRKNNNFKNLVWICRNCHFLVHHYDEENQGLLKKLTI